MSGSRRPPTGHRFLRTTSPGPPPDVEEEKDEGGTRWGTDPVVFSVSDRLRDGSFRVGPRLYRRSPAPETFRHRRRGKGRTSALLCLRSPPDFGLILRHHYPRPFHHFVRPGLDSPPFCRDESRTTPPPPPRFGVTREETVLGRSSNMRSSPTLPFGKVDRPSVDPKATTETTHRTPFTNGRDPNLEGYLLLSF